MKGAPGGGGFTQQRFLQRGSSPRSDLLNLLYTNLTDKGKKQPFRINAWLVSQWLKNTPDFNYLRTAFLKFSRERFSGALATTTAEE